MNEETKPPEGLGLATTLCGHAFCTNACTEDQMRAAVSAIHAEHVQRLALQHHAADLAQRVADLEAACDMLRHEHHTVRSDAQARVDAAVIRALAAEKERDEWRQLASAYSPAKELAEALKQSKASGDAARKERDELRARLAGNAFPEGWKLVPVEATEAMLDAEAASCGPAWGAMIAAAPEHKA